MIRILYEDRDVIVVWKPVGVESQESRGLGADMVSEIRRHIHKLSPAGGIPYVGVIHRLDKPVSGILVYAKTKKVAAALSKQVAEGKVQKKYLAVLCGKVVDNVDNFVDYLLKEEKGNVSRIVDKGITGAKQARLSYRILEEQETKAFGILSLAEITLQTGRHHQIRVQMAGHGLPLWGDNKYNPAFAENKSAGVHAAGAPDAEVSAAGIPAAAAPCMVGQRPPLRADIALAAYRLAFGHPVTGKRMEFTAMPQGQIFQEFAWIRERQ